jgi:hypothetical protein
MPCVKSGSSAVRMDRQWVVYSKEQSSLGGGGVELFSRTESTYTDFDYGDEDH